MSLVEDAVRGAIIGAAIGAGLCAASHTMKARQRAAEGLRVRGRECQWLRADPQLNELVARFEDIAIFGSESVALFDNIVEGCETLLRCVHDDTRSTRAIHANRALSSAIRAAKTLCRVAMAKGSDRAHELLRDVDQLEALGNNHMHNMMI